MHFCSTKSTTLLEKIPYKIICLTHIFENITLNYSDERVLCSAPQTCLADCMYKKRT